MQRVVGRDTSGPEYPATPAGHETYEHFPLPMLTRFVLDFGPRFLASLSARLARANRLISTSSCTAMCGGEGCEAEELREPRLRHMMDDTEEWWRLRMVPMDMSTESAHFKLKIV